MNSVLVIRNINKLFICDKPVINVEQVFIQGRLNEVDNCHSNNSDGYHQCKFFMFKMKQTIGQIIDI